MKKDRTRITLINRIFADKRIGVNHKHFNPKQSEAMPIRALSVFFCVAKESSSFIRVIRVPIIPVHLKVIRVPIIAVRPKNIPLSYYLRTTFVFIIVNKYFINAEF